MTTNLTYLVIDKSCSHFSGGPGVGGGALNTLPVHVLDICKNVPF